MLKNGAHARFHLNKDSNGFENEMKFVTWIKQK